MDEMPLLAVQNTPGCVNLQVDRSELEKGFTYQEGGLDWDNATWSCASGSLQSPVNLPSPVGGPFLATAAASCCRAWCLQPCQSGLLESGQWLRSGRDVY